MKEQRTASLAEFERMADMLTDLATTEYLSRVELTPKLVVMGVDPAAAAQPGYRFGLIPVAELMTRAAGTPGELVVAALIEKLSKDPEVLVVGHIAEAWRAQYTKEERARPGFQLAPEEAPNREEVLLLNLRSADCMALKTCSLTRDGLRTKIGTGELLFNARVHNSRRCRYTH